MIEDVLNYQNRVYIIQNMQALMKTRVAYIKLKMNMI